jgi:hypothetical protein
VGRSLAWYCFGISLRDAATGRFTLWQVTQTGDNYPELNRMTSATGGVSNVLAAHGYVALASPLYLRIRKNSATSYDFGISLDGAGWFTALAAHNPTAHHTPDQVGFHANTGNSIAGQTVAIDWLRFS